MFVVGERGWHTSEIDVQERSTSIRQFGDSGGGGGGVLERGDAASEVGHLAPQAVRGDTRAIQCGCGCHLKSGHCAVVQPSLTLTLYSSRTSPN